MLKNEASGTDWRLEEYRLLAAQVAQRQGFRVGLRRTAVGLLSVLAGLHYLMPRLSSSGGLPGPELLFFGVFVIVGAWLLELAHSVAQDRAETRIRRIESALAGEGSRIGHDLRARQRPDPTPASPQLGHVMKGEGRGLVRDLGNALRSLSLGGFYLVLLGAFGAWYALADPGAGLETTSSAPTLGEQLEGIGTSVREIPGRLDRIADSLSVLPEEMARSIPADPPTILVDVEPPDLAPILRSLEEILSGLAALEEAIRELEPPQAEATTPPAPVQECEGRAWGIGSSSLSCSSAKP